ncbi:MAG TPA: hypothetical protein VKX29_05150 [Brumimicrobium sp.]|nr:hypothetical protein [Brumimicrobium sp.]
MLDSLRNKISNLSIGAKFAIRIIYPIGLYIAFYFLLHRVFNTPLQSTQLIFILTWALIEWQLFLKKPST